MIKNIAGRLLSQYTVFTVFYLQFTVCQVGRLINGPNPNVFALIKYFFQKTVLSVLRFDFFLCSFLISISMQTLFVSGDGVPLNIPNVVFHDILRFSVLYVFK